MRAGDPPTRRFTFTVEGHAHTKDDLADMLREIAYDIELDRSVATVSSRGFSFKVTDNGGPTKDEYDRQLNEWVSRKRLPSDDEAAAKATVGPDR